MLSGLGKLVGKGLEAGAPSLDEGAWLISVATSTNGFVLCSLSGDPTDVSLFNLLVTKIGGATEGIVADAAESVLRHAGEIENLSIESD